MKDIDETQSESVENDHLSDELGLESANFTSNINIGVQSESRQGDYELVTESSRAYSE